MTNLEKHTHAFVDAFEIDANATKSLEYQAIPEWDSVGHMALIVILEEAFGIMLETDDIIDFSPFEKGQEILEKYDVAL